MEKTRVAVSITVTIGDQSENFDIESSTTGDPFKAAESAVLTAKADATDYVLTRRAQDREDRLNAEIAQVEATAKAKK